MVFLLKFAFCFQSPETYYSFGRIRGYYVGYKELYSTGPYTYKTVTLESAVVNGLDNSISNYKPEALLKNLRRNTKYEIIIQPYNTKGGGLVSEVIHAQTLTEGKQFNSFLKNNFLYFFIFLLQTLQVRQHLHLLKLPPTRFLLVGIQTNPKIRQQVCTKLFLTFNTCNVFRLFVSKI